MPHNFEIIFFSLKWNITKPGSKTGSLQKNNYDDFLTVIIDVKNFFSNCYTNNAKSSMQPTVGYPLLSVRRMWCTVSVTDLV